MLNFLRSKKSFIFPCILVFIAIISHAEWFHFDSTLIKGDWGYWFTDYVAKTPSFYGTWLTHQGFGSPNVQIYFNIFFYPASLLSGLGLTTQAAYKINLFIPIAIFGFLSPYFLARKIIANEFISFVSALFYGSNTYFLSIQTGHLPIAFVYSIAPFIFIAFMHALEKNKIRDWIIFSLIYSIGIGYELRIMYIFSFILFFYFLFFYIKKIRTYLSHFILFGVIVLLLNLYWLLPTLFGGVTGSISEIANRGLFGGSLTDVLRAFTTSQWSWTGGSPNREFEPQSIAIYFWFLPFFIFSVLSFRKNKYLAQVSFYLFILLLGVLLAKQSAPPFEKLYLFLYEYFPGFRLFRESSKFYLLLAFSYTGILTYTLLILKKANIRLFYVVSVLFILTFLFTLKPLITKEYRTLFVDRTMPRDYSIFAEHITSEDEDYRILWIPRNSQWAYFSADNPKVSMMGSILREWRRYVEEEEEMTGGEMAISILNNSYANNIMDIFSIKYLVVPIQDKSGLEQNLFAYYSEDRNSYIETLDKLNFLKRINLGEKEAVIYENSSFKPRVYLTKEKETLANNIPYDKVEYNRKSPSEIEVSIGSLSEPIYLNFSEAYHSNWKVRVGEFSWAGALFDSNYFIPDSDHFRNDFDLNSFIINPQEICSSFVCSKNGDGVYDIKITLYFKTQSYFYLGIIISLLASASLIGYLVFVYFKNYHDKK